jgi:hypothetical protein
MAIAALRQILHRGWRLTAAGACLWTACALDGNSASASSSHLTVLGASDGQVKISAATSAVRLSLTLENDDTLPAKPEIRVAPFRDAAGQVYPSHLLTGTTTPSPATAPPTAVPQGSLGTPPADSRRSIEVPAQGAADFTVSGDLESEGEYSTEIVVANGNSPLVIHLSISRASRDLGVEIPAVDPATSVANAFGHHSKATLNIVLAEKSGRAVTLDSPILTKFTRKQSQGIAAQASVDMRLLGPDGQPLVKDGIVSLAPNQTLPVTVSLTKLVGNGEYQGTLRIMARGAKPVDQTFTVTLRESAWVAFWLIFAGVVASAGLRILSQTLRPRLLLVRRAQVLVRDLDITLAEPGRENEEIELLRALRRQVAAELIQLQSGSMQDAQSRLDGLERRASLIGDWISLRRRVDSIALPALRGKFRTKIEQVRGVIASDSSAEAIKDAAKDLAAMPAEIDQALRAEVQSRIQKLQDALAALPSTADTSQAHAREVIEKLLLSARAAMATDLPTALRDYSAAYAAWIRLQIDSLNAELSHSQPPFGVAPEAWQRTVKAIQQQLAEARHLIDADLDRADTLYQAAITSYVTAVCNAVEAGMAEVSKKAEKLDDAQRGPIVQMLDKLAEVIAEVRLALTVHDTGQALQQARAAVKMLSDAQHKLPGTRGYVADVVRGYFTGIAGPLPGPIANPLASIKVTDRDIKWSTSLISGIDLISLVVAILVATLLGITTLWSAKATWGGWEDHILAILWGLGLHQFTFAGVSALTDQLTGSKTAAAT